MDAMDVEQDSKITDTLDLLLENVIVGTNQKSLFGMCQPGRLPSGARRKFKDIGISEDYFISKREIQSGDISTTVIQCSVHKQLKKSVSCGYHAIHNSLSIMNLLTQEDSRVHQTILGFLNTPIVPDSDTYAMTADDHIPSSVPDWPKTFHTTSGAYNESFQNTKAELYKVHNLAKEISSHLYPWDAGTIESGILERAHLQRLVLTHDRMAAVASRLGKLPNEVFFNIPELYREHVQPLHQIFSQESYVIAFLVGNVNHWNTIVVHRNRNEIEIILADSHNRDLLYIDEDKVRDFYSNVNEEDPTKRFFNWSNFHKMVQCKTNVDMFINCANRRTTIHTVFCDQNVELVIKSLSENAMKEGSFTPESLENWTREYWPITVLRKTHLNRLRKVGWQHISDQLRRRYEAIIQQILLVQCNGDLTNLQAVFSDILTELQPKANL